MGMTIGKKIGAVISLILIVFLISGVVSYFQLKRIEGTDRRLIEITEKDEPERAATYEMEINLIGTGFGLLGYLHDHDPIHLEGIKKDVGDFARYQKIYEEFAVILPDIPGEQAEIILNKL